MAQKERLVELIKPYMIGLSEANCEKLAEYLIHNGVVVLPTIRDDMCIDDYLFEIDRIVVEYYGKKKMEMEQED